MFFSILVEGYVYNIEFAYVSDKRSVRTPWRWLCTLAETRIWYKQYNKLDERFYFYDSLQGTLISYLCYLHYILC
jgi:hypothetical protein